MGLRVYTAARARSKEFNEGKYKPAWKHAVKLSYKGPYIKDVEEFNEGKYKPAWKQAVKLSGPFIKDVHKIFGILDPLPPCPHFG